MASRSKSRLWTPVGVESLEDRLQPGSLLWSGLDSVPLREVLPSPQPPEDHVLRVISSKRTSDSNSDNAAPPSHLAATRELITSPTRTTSVSASPAPDNQLPLTTTPSTAGRATAPQSMLPPAIQASDARLVTAPPVSGQTAHSKPVANVSNAGAIRSFPVHEARAPGIVQHSQTRIAPFDPANYVKTECNNTAGKANLYNTYDGTPNDDQNFAVVSGKAANLGEAYAVGYKGPDGSVSHFSAAGACLGSYLVTTGNGTWVRDVAVNNNGVYITGNQPGGISSFIIHLTSNLTFVNGITVIAPLSGSVFFNSVALGPAPSAPDVVVTGSWFDPFSATPFDITKVFSHNFTLTGIPNYDVNIFFPTGPSVGLSVALDRGVVAYIGGRASTTGNPTDMPHSFKLFPNATLGYSVVTLSGSPISDLQNGFHGVFLLGGISTASGLYETGSIADSIANANGEQNLLLYRRNQFTGGIVYGFLYSIANADFAGKANVVNRVGNQFVAGYRGTFGNHDAVVLRYSSNGVTLLDSKALGGAGFEDRGFGIDLRTPQPGDNVMIAGITETPDAFMVPTPTLCDPTWNGLVDGFVAQWSQPF